MIQTAIEASREAGAYLVSHLGKIKTIERKKGQETNLVTEIDKESERMIVSRIHASYPEHAILGEEGGRLDTDSEYCWVIDPLDGTTNYTHSFPIFSVSIGIQHRGKLIGGVVFDPIADELFSAEEGSGSFLNGTRLHVSETDTLINSLLVTGFPYNVRENPFNVVQHFQQFLMEAQGVRRLGSAALDLCYVAAGRLDGYWEVTLQPWDKAAGIVIVQEAGGTVTDFHGKPTNFQNPNTLASNGKIHSLMLAVIEKSL
ncbi:MAG: inositol monophosphatase family protein [Ignavibacteriales bacterium]|nr:inositol monophosphatase family protein [Ignavibacteriales bacterium]